ncbi:Uncharacterised protein [Klebsiella pneumoniae]|nr:Uncharacterised protein [Klebsiella pneumoniae]
MDKLLNMLRYKSEGSDIDFKSTQYRFNNGSEGNDSNLLIVFYVQIMPDDFRPSRARCCLRFRLCRSIRCVYRLLITCSFPFRRDSYSGQPSVIHITTSKGDSRLIKRPSVGIVRSPNTCANRLPEPVIRVKQPALARFSPDIAPLFVHFRADDDVTARLYARGYRLRPEFFK